MLELFNKYLSDEKLTSFNFKQILNDYAFSSVDIVIISIITFNINTVELTIVHLDFNAEYVTINRLPLIRKVKYKKLCLMY